MANQILLQLLNGLFVGSSLALVAAGLALLFGVLHIINFAQGDFYMLGGYAVWFVLGVTHNYFLSLVLGGIDHVTPGNNNGYNAYMSMTALILAMRKANFTGKADTDKLVAAFETLTVPQGPDFPDGQLIMNKDDHQGRTTYYLLKIDGQKEEILQTIPADQLPTIGDCKIQ